MLLLYLQYLLRVCCVRKAALPGNAATKVNLFSTAWTFCDFCLL